MFDFQVPVRVNNSKLFPTEAITYFTHDENTLPYLIWKEDDKMKDQISKCKSINDYLISFKTYARGFDLHSHTFQDWALNYTNSIGPDETYLLSRKRDFALIRILRARVYAIATRPDIDWDGKKLDDPDRIKAKMQIMQSHLKSLKLYDWTKSNELDFLSENPKKTCIIEVKNNDTQTVTIELCQKYQSQGKKICFLDLAAGHNVCGAYSVDHGGSQEEDVMTNCDGAALLGVYGEFKHKGVKAVIRGTWVRYRLGYHIPPGGNYFGDARFITGSEQCECSFIATAFADFRPYVTHFHPYSELLDYYTILGSVKNQKMLEERLLLDMRGTIATAIKEKVDVLVLGASGCGAFKHDAPLEAKLWHKVLVESDGFFEHIVFAVLDSKDGKNIVAFSKEFSN